MTDSFPDPRDRRRRRRLIEAVALAASFGAACASADQSVTSPTMAAYEGRRPNGLARMVFDEFHGLSRATLERAAVPWKALGAALIVYRRQRDPRLPVSEAAYLDLLQRRYGFVRPARVANWPAGETQPLFTRPLGMLQGTLRQSLLGVEIDLTNIGCSTCHGANLYDAAGDPTRDVWIGLPSGSIDLGRFSDDAFAAFHYAGGHLDETMAAMKQMFPDTSETELRTLRRYYFPQIKETLDKRLATLGAYRSYSNGSPGLTNGVATLKLFLGASDGTHVDPTEVAFAGTPDLAGLRLRPSILCDGVYAPPGWSHTGPLSPAIARDAQKDAIAGVVAVVTIGTTGVSPAVAVDNIPRIRDVVSWIMDDYHPPPFPGAVDATLARQGAAIFTAECGRCHGDYEETPGGLRLAHFPSQVVPADVIDTDPTRAAAPGSAPNQLFAKTAMRSHLDARNMSGYIAPPLTSLWATAPYLHNGSVPTLWHLMHPEARPARFQVGGHRLSFEKVGIDGDVRDGVYRYPERYRPWMEPEIYDTRAPGRSNAGHAEMFDGMSETDKAALLEFLKRV